MITRKEKKTLPIQKAFIVREEGRTPLWMFHCTCCNRWHTHGFCEGDDKLRNGSARANHCEVGVDFNGYMLKSYTQKELKDIIKWATDRLGEKV